MKKVCLIGYPAKHSLSPAIHGYWLEKYGIEGKYEIRETLPENFDNFFRNLAEEGYVGCNITVPFKERAFELLSYDEKTGGAGDTGAVNTILIKNNGRLGTNTDLDGFRSNVISRGFNFKIKNAVILGAGGAARAVLGILVSEQIENIIITNRSIKKAEAIKREIFQKLYSHSKNNIKIVPWESRNEALKNANLLVNTTSLGMVGQPPLDIDLSLLPKDALVTDIVYRPLITPLLQAAKDRGNPIVDGLGMLLYQAVPGFEMWFAEELNGRKVEVTAELRQKIESLL